MKQFKDIPQTSTTIRIRIQPDLLPRILNTEPLFVGVQAYTLSSKVFAQIQFRQFDIARLRRTDSQQRVPDDFIFFFDFP